MTHRAVLASPPGRAHRHRRRARQLRRGQEQHASARAPSSTTSATSAMPRSAQGVNIGAGTITANYDGQRKHRTTHRRRRLHRLGHDPARAGDASATGAVTGAGSWSPATCPPGTIAVGVPARIRHAARRADDAARARVTASPPSLMGSPPRAPHHRPAHRPQRRVRGRRDRARHGPTQPAPAAHRRGRPRRPPGARASSSSPAASWPSIQLGITFVGFLAAAFAGASIADALADGLRDDPACSAASADLLALLIVTLVVSLVTIVFGELVPKTLALAHAERYALLFARPVELLGRILRAGRLGADARSRTASPGCSASATSPTRPITHRGADASSSSGAGSRASSRPRRSR